MSPSPVAYVPACVFFALGALCVLFVGLANVGLCVRRSALRRHGLGVLLVLQLGIVGLLPACLYVAVAMLPNGGNSQVQWTHALQTASAAGLPLVFVPVCVLYGRLAMAYHGHPRLCPPGWVSALSVDLAAYGLRWMVAVLGATLLPLYALLLAREALVHSWPDPSVSVARIRVAYYALQLLLLLGFAVLVVLLWRVRGALRPHDLDQTRQLLAYLITFSTHFAMHVVCATTMQSQPPALCTPPYLAMGVGVCLGLLLFLAMALWIANFRIVARRAATASRTHSFGARASIGDTGHEGLRELSNSTLLAQSLDFAIKTGLSSYTPRSSLSGRTPRPSISHPNNGPHASHGTMGHTRQLSAESARRVVTPTGSMPHLHMGGGTDTHTGGPCGDLACTQAACTATYSHGQDHLTIEDGRLGGSSETLPGHAML